MKEENKRTVLVVEDDSITLKTVSAVLQRYGFNIITSTAGDNAVELAANRADIDLVLMDVFLGDGIDGIEAARRILKTRDIPVVFHSTHSGKEVVSEIEKIQCYGYVVKNNGDSVLIATINTAIRLHDAHTEIIKYNKVEDALKKSEQNYREVFNSTNEAIFIDEAATGRMIDVNESMLRMYGYDSMEEVLAGNIGDLSVGEPPYGQKEAEEHIRRAIYDGPQTFEWLAKKKSGDTFWAEVSLRSSKIGGEGRILAVVRDISERKHSEDILKQKTEALKEALDAKNALLYELQHRVKNTLSMIAGLVELESLNSTVPDTGSVLSKLSMRIGSISNLYSLLYSSGDLRRIRLDHYFNSIISSLSSTFINGNPGITVKSELECIEVDSERAAPFGLVLNELFTNTLKYAFKEAEHGIVWIRLWRSDGRIHLSVSDNGIGLPDDFDIDKSSGMGMMLIQMLTNQLGGNVSFDTTASTVFTVSVPDILPGHNCCFMK